MTAGACTQDRGDHASNLGGVAVEGGAPVAVPVQVAVIGEVDGAEPGRAGLVTSMLVVASNESQSSLIRKVTVRPRSSKGSPDRAFDRGTPGRRRCRGCCWSRAVRRGCG